MANVHDDTAGAEHPGFLQKIKDKLHIGHHHKDKEVAPATSPKSTDTAVASKSTSTETDAPAAAPPVSEEPAIAKPSPPIEHEPHHPTPDLNKPVGHESEHHGGTPTVPVASPDQDIPDEGTKGTATSDDAQGGEFFDSEEGFSEAQKGEHHDGVPTFLVALPDKDLPDEETKEHLHHVTAGQDSEGAQHSPNKSLDSEEVFSNAQEGEHHGGVPTFLVALPDEEIPGEVNKEVSSDVAGKDADDSGVKQEIDSEKVINKAQQGEHDEGVPTSVIASPDQVLPGEETKEKLHHESAGQTEDA
jgi:hypothetical protein